MLAELGVHDCTPMPASVQENCGVTACPKYWNDVPTRTPVPAQRVPPAFARSRKCQAGPDASLYATTTRLTVAAPSGSVTSRAKVTDVPRSCAFRVLNVGGV